jgi:hypothetical protein
VGLRNRIQRARRVTEAATIVLSCPECGETLRVSENTDLDYLAHRWVEETGEKSYQPTPPDVFLLTARPYPVEKFIDLRSGKPWLEELENAGGHRAQ